MDKNAWFAIGFVIIIVLVLVFTLKPSISNDNATKQVNLYDTKSSESEVTIDLTPTEFKDGKFYVNIGVDTHTIELDQFNLNELVELNYNNKIIKPESAPALKGHHNTGVLLFNTGTKPDKFSIIIKNIPNINERAFTCG